MFHGSEGGLRFQHHARAAPELVVVGGAVPVGGKAPDVHDAYRYQAPLHGPPHHAEFHGAGEGFREQRQHVKPHGRIPNQCTVGAGPMRVDPTPSDLAMPARPVAGQARAAGYCMVLRLS